MIEEHIECLALHLCVKSEMGLVCLGLGLDERGREGGRGRERDKIEREFLQ